MTTAKKVLLGLGGFVVLMGVVGTVNSPAEKQPSKELVQSVSQVKETSDSMPNTKEKKPVTEVKTMEEAVALPYQSISQNDNTLAVGQTAIAVAGVNGEKIITYKATYTNGVETARQQTAERISKQPISEVRKIGTKVAAAPRPATTSNCSPNYSGCVPIASDVDCAGGSGNGPAYVSGPIRVIGVDVYDLDRDGNGLACE